MMSIFPAQNQHWQKMREIVDELMAHPESEDFREPVPWKRLGLHDYPAVVKYPMDLGTIQNRLRIGFYDDIVVVAQDIRMVWHNCLMYNGNEQSKHYKMAFTLRDIFEDRYTKLLKEISKAPENGISGVCIQDRRDLTVMLHQLSDEALGAFLVEIDTKCPAAVTRNDDDELELNMDVIPGSFVLELKDRFKGTVQCPATQRHESALSVLASKSR